MGSVNSVISARSQQRPESDSQPRQAGAQAFVRVDSRNSLQTVEGARRVGKNDGTKELANKNAQQTDLVRLESTFWRYKAEIMPNRQTLKQLDNLAICAPANLISDERKLVDYLVQGLRKDVEKVRTIAIWIASHISYDTVERWPSNDPVDVLQSQKAICGGFCRLFEYLCRLAHVECKYVSGLARGIEFNPATRISWDSKSFRIIDADPNEHAWNTVIIDDRSYMIDLTWAAGVLTINEQGEKEFVFKWQEEWFLCDPGVFVLTHIPYKNREPYPSRQCIPRPITNLHEWLRTPVLSPLFFDFGLQVADISIGRSLWLPTDPLNRALLALRCTFETRLSAKLYRITETDVVPIQGDYSMCSSDGATATVLIFLPEAGRYKLEIYGALVFAETALKELKLLGICAIEGTNSQARHLPLPSGVWPYWGANYFARSVGVKLVSHAQNWIETRSNGTAELRFEARPLALKFELVDDEERTRNMSSNFYAFRDPNGVVFVRLFLPRRGRYLLSVLVNVSQTWERCANYLVKSRASNAGGNEAIMIPNPGNYPGHSSILGPSMTAAKRFTLAFTDDVGYRRSAETLWKAQVHCGDLARCAPTDIQCVAFVVAPFRGDEEEVGFVKASVLTKVFGKKGAMEQTIAQFEVRVPRQFMDVDCFLFVRLEVFTRYPGADDALVSGVETKETIGAFLIERAM